ncbi:MAG TPA: hydroxymethylbilane synthase [Methanosarcinales archaeon]|nr:hydroxymethylbilane synthase [Methanosarcinales archaeon]
MIIGTRGSALALKQTEIVAKLLSDRGIQTTQKIIKTSGDTFIDRALHEVSGVGVFVREIDDRILKGEVDIAVHSMKDVPTKRAKGLSIAAVLKRDSPYDVLLKKTNKPLNKSIGGVIGTSSLRRRAQLLRFKKDLIIKNLRGNIDTRMRKLKEGQYDGIILAEAGLTRLGYKLGAKATMNIGFYRLDPDNFVPSANQGTIVVVAKKGSEEENIVKSLDHTQTRIETEVERIILNILGGGCKVPIGVFANLNKNKNEIHVRAEVLSIDGKKYVNINKYIPVQEYKDYAKELGKELKEKGGSELIKEVINRLKV